MKGRNKLIIIIGICLLVVALSLFLIGGSLSGWDIWGMFTGQPAIWSYIIVGFGLFFLGYVFVSDKINGD